MKGGEIMDQALFKYYVARKGYKLNEIAEILGVNSSTLYRKITGENDFTRSEIITLKNILELTIEELDKLFFNEKLA